MIAFWVSAGVLSAGLAILILLRAARAGAGPATADAAQGFYHRQIAEIAELADRGLLGGEERRIAEAEAGRRLLAGAELPAETWTTQGRPAVLFGVVGAPLLALALYLAVGSPGMGDAPFAGRLSQWMTQNPESLAPPQMAAVLNQLAKRRPNDAEGFRYLALAEGAADNPAGAVRAMRRAVRLAPERGDLWEMLGEALIYQNGGQVDAAAKAAFLETLKRDPRNIPARFHLARARIAADDKAGGLADWRALLADMPAADPRRSALRAAIAEAQGAAPAFSADEMGAIRGMVASLAEKLKRNPDDPAGWVQMVRAYAVLGDAAKRDATLVAARARYAADPDSLDKLAEAARAEPLR